LWSKWDWQNKQVDSIAFSRIASAFAFANDSYNDFSNDFTMISKFSGKGIFFKRVTVKA
jgi:hypothetical protein